MTIDWYEEKNVGPASHELMQRIFNAKSVTLSPLPHNLDLTVACRRGQIVR